MKRETVPIGGMKYARFTLAERIYIKELWELGTSKRQIANLFKVSESMIVRELCLGTEGEFVSRGKRSKYDPHLAHERGELSFSMDERIAEIQTRLEAQNNANKPESK